MQVNAQPSYFILIFCLFFLRIFTADFSFVKSVRTPFELEKFLQFYTMDEQLVNKLNHLSNLPSGFSSFVKGVDKLGFPTPDAFSADTRK